MSQFECDNCGELDKYIGCKITHKTSENRHKLLKFTNSVLFQNFDDNFDLPTRSCPMPVTAGDVLEKYEKEDAV